MPSGDWGNINSPFVLDVGFKIIPIKLINGPDSELSKLLAAWPVLRVVTT
jgi:hypothetical protein